MGMARNASAGDKGQSRWKARRKAIETKGVPIPGTGVSHGHRRAGHRNLTGATFHAPKEWGVENRKWEERQTDLARMAQQHAIAEGLKDGEPDAFDLKVAAEDAEAAHLWAEERYREMWAEDHWGYDDPDEFRADEAILDLDCEDVRNDLYAGTDNDEGNDF